MGEQQKPQPIACPYLDSCPESNYGDYEYCGNHRHQLCELYKKRLAGDLEENSNHEAQKWDENIFRTIGLRGAFGQ